MTTAMPLISLAATYPAYECCTCTVYAAQGNLVAKPLYAMLWVCPGCREGVCAKHLRPCGLCWGCCAETHGGHP